MENEKVSKKAKYACPDFEVASLPDDDILNQVSAVFQPDKDWGSDDWFQP